jgi:hypothetical protein
MSLKETLRAKPNKKLFSPSFAVLEKRETSTIYYT